MAHFAELDDNNVVLRVVVVANKDTADASGEEKEHIGQAFCERLFGGRWVQTSYNRNFRKNYAGIGYTYDAALDAFIPPKPYPSWTLNPETYYWIPPTEAPPPKPNTYYVWDEATQSWIETPVPT